MTYDYDQLLKTMNIYSKSSDDFWDDYKKNVIDSDNIMSLVMEYVPFIKPKINIKIALIGSSCVGKTTFLKRLSNNNFERSYVKTESYNISIIIRDNITYEFYDFAGDELYCHVYDTEFYEIFDVVFLMVDNSRISYKNGKEWLRKINIRNVPTFKIRNKCDINDEFSNLNGYINISTKTGQGVDNVLERIVIE